uniref:Transmembrane protein 144 n=1 Tax=Acrobeloides nanus TaxID=290746 RepID=A0A914DRH3_9BILA
MSAIIGLLACAVASLFFGTMFVPVRKYASGDGLFVQWVMSSAILVVGIIVNMFVGFPAFQPLAMIGGVCWAIGNVTAVPIISTIGLGLGILIWGTTNCLVGWACGRFGLFGINASEPRSPVINYFGLVLVIIGGFLFSQVRSTVSQVDEGDHNEEGRSSVPEEERLDEEDAGLVRNYEATNTTINRSTKRAFGIGLSLFAGVFYGVTFVPVVYIQDHHDKFPSAPESAIAFALSHYCGIYLTSTAFFFIYLVYTQNRPFINPKIALPSLITGLFWAIAQLSW